MNKEWVTGNTDVLYSRCYQHTPSFIARTAYFYIQTAGHFKCHKEYLTKREKYKSYLLLYSLKGKGYLKYKGKHYEIVPNQVMLIDCYAYQEYYTDRDALWEMKWVHFHGGKSEEYYKIIYGNYGPVITLPETNRILRYIEELMHLMKKGDIQFETKASCIILQMLTEILLTPGDAKGGIGNEKYDTQVEPALEYIERNYHTTVTLDTLAAVSCLSKYHFIRLFKRTTGFSPYEYLNKYRLNRAKDLLTTTDKTVEDIALSVGFSSVSNFIKTFRELEELTPLKYRKLWTK